MSKLESQKGGSGEGSWEAFWGRKTVPKVVFEGCMMVAEKDENFGAKIEAPGFPGPARASSGLRGPAAGWPLQRFKIPEIRDQKSDVRK